jgi:hypothetical protein
MFSNPKVQRKVAKRPISAALKILKTGRIDFAIVAVLYSHYTNVAVSK